MDNQNNNTVNEPSEKLAFTMFDYESFVENGGCKYTDCMATNLQGSSHRPRAVGFRLRN